MAHCEPPNPRRPLRSTEFRPKLPNDSNVAARASGIRIAMHPEVPKQGNALCPSRRLLGALASAFVSAACSSAPTEATDWSAAFQAQHEELGWSGGDGAYSVPLPSARTLWLFGDSYLGEVGPKGRTASSIRFGNTIAIQNNRPDQTPPTGADLIFDWGPPNTNGWLPLTWDVLLDPSAPESVRVAHDAGLGALAWPLHGITVGSDLVLFNVPVSPIDCPSCGMYSFKVHGSVASVIRGVDRPYSDWGFHRDTGWDDSSRPEQRFVPHSRTTPDLDDPTWLFWGNFVMRDPTGSNDLYVYGHRRLGDDNSLVVAKVPDVGRATDVLEFDRWLFWDGSSWTENPDRAEPIASDTATEYSVVPVPPSRGRGYALVETKRPMSIEVRVSLADDPWGPFTEKYVLSLADCPIGGFSEATDLTYAAKAHPERSTDDSLLISLVVTSKPGVSNIVTTANTGIYVPRFLDVPWAEVFAHGHSSKERCGG